MVGTASTPTGTGPWYWTCAGTNGGTTASCSANFGTTPATGTASKAKVYLGVDDVFHAGDSGLTAYGGSGYDTVIIAAGVSGITLDQNVDRVNFTGAAGSYTFKQTGNKINVYDAAGATMLVSVPVQGDADGTVIGFSNGVASAQLTNGIMTLGGTTVSDTALGIASPVLPTTTTSAVTTTTTSTTTTTPAATTTTPAATTTTPAATTTTTSTTTTTPAATTTTTPTTTTTTL